MATQAVCASFLLECLTAVHDFSADVFNLALYDSSAAMNASTTAYSTDHEVVGAGYSAGGVALANIAPSISGTSACASFQTATLSSITVSGIRYGLVYNTSKANRAVCVLDFGRDMSKTAADFVVTFPPVPNTIIKLGMA